MLFIPGEDFNPAHFDIAHAYVHARSLVGWPETLALVKPFAHSPDPGIRRQACSQLNDGGSPWNTECLE